MEAVGTPAPMLFMNANLDEDVLVPPSKRSSVIFVGCIAPEFLWIQPTVPCVPLTTRLLSICKDPLTSNFPLTRRSSAADKKLPVDVCPLPILLYPTNVFVDEVP